VLARTLIVPACAALLLGGCGNTRTPVQSTAQPAKPTGFKSLVYRSAGVQLVAPVNWSVSSQKAPLVSVVSSGSAIVAVWRFPRTAPVPATPAALRRASAGLVSQARVRDQSIQIIRARPLSLQTAPAIELDAIEHVNGAIRRVRSTHICVAGAGLVLDEYAPPNLFHAVDHSVFSPVKRSLKLLGAGAPG
jgi:hypothetical protein